MEQIYKNMRHIWKIFVIMSVLIVTLSANAISDNSYDDYGLGVPSGSGTGTGGKGVITKESISNIEKHETIVRNLLANTQIIYTYTVPKLAIYQLLVTAKKDEEYVAIRVEMLKDKSLLVNESAPGNVYKNENVWLGSTDIDNVIVRFRIENSWIDKTNREDIQLLKWGSSWYPLEIKEINRDDNYTYFESNITESSILAISSSKEEILTELPPTADLTGTQTPIVTGTTTPAEKVPGFEIVVGIMAVSIICIFRKSPK